MVRTALPLSNDSAVSVRVNWREEVDGVRLDDLVRVIRLRRVKPGSVFVKEDNCFTVC